MPSPNSDPRTYHPKTITTALLFVVTFHERLAFLLSDLTRRQLKQLFPFLGFVIFYTLLVCKWASNHGSWEFFVVTLVFFTYFPRTEASVLVENFLGSTI